MKCPKCKSEAVTHIPSSTMPIDDKTKTYFSGKKVSEEDWKKHKAIKNICRDCLHEW